MNKCYIVFTKYFDDLNSKTKLRADIDEKTVNDFNKACFVTIKEKLEGCNVYWSVHNVQKKRHSLYEKEEVIFQEGVKLSEILIHTIEQVRDRYDQVGILGTDCPQIDLNEIDSAKGEYLLGQCADGGFYYFEFPSHMDLNVFKEVRYSSEFAASDLIKNITPEISLLSPRFDVDRIEDFNRIKEIYLKEDLFNNPMSKFFKGLNG